MTTWKPPTAPYLEIQYGLCTDNDGTKLVTTRFRKALVAFPVAVGSSYNAVQVTGLTAVRHDAHSFRVCVNASEGLIATQSQQFDILIYGIL